MSFYIRAVQTNKLKLFNNIQQNMYTHALLLPTKKKWYLLFLPDKKALWLWKSIEKTEYLINGSACAEISLLLK